MTDSIRTPLHVAAAQGTKATENHAEIVTMLIRAGADVHARDIAEQTPLHLIGANGAVESIPVARALLDGGASVHEENRLGMDCTFVLHGAEVRELLRGAAGKT